ncbi:MAG: DNA-binding transcriptional regulator [Pirellulales bacterium]|nr:DNA-binding transcriptional regulator [Planctomycetales bacterium]
MNAAAPDTNSPSEQTPRRVAVVTETATSWGAGIVEGVANFAQRHANWSLFVEPRGKYEELMLPERWNGDGVIARVTHEALSRQIIRSGLPAVDVSWFHLGDDQIAHCTADEDAAGRLAAEYFMDRGYRHFAYCAACHRPRYVDRLFDAYQATLKSQGFSCDVYAAKERPVDGGSAPPVDAIANLANWLRSLPTPIGLFAFDAVRGRQVTDACATLGVRVPEDVAVLGGEHDQLSSRISQPQLSSVDLSPERVGYEAARMLSAMFADPALRPPPVSISPIRVITRRSTDTIASENKEVAAALRFIHEHVHDRINVSDILVAVPTSRRHIEQLFRRELGRSPAEEIRRQRVQNAKQLLVSTSWTMNRIAAECGLERPEVLSRTFRREVGMTPSEFRQRFSASPRGHS